MYSDNLNAEPQGKVVPSSQRKDGTWRKEIKIRPGYVNQDEVARYQNPKKREEEEKNRIIREVKARYAVPEVQETEEKKKKKRIRKKKEHGEEVKNDDNDDPREVPDDWENDGEQASEAKGQDVAQKGANHNKKEDKEEDDQKKEGDEDDPQKQEKKIKKKLRQIELLEQKHAEGKALNHEELAKISSKKGLEEMLENLKIH